MMLHRRSVQLLEYTKRATAMPLQHNRTVEVADQLVNLCNTGANYLSDLQRFLELNSDLSIDWSMATPTPTTATRFRPPGGVL